MLNGPLSRQQATHTLRLDLEVEVALTPASSAPLEPVVLAARLVDVDGHIAAWTSSALDPAGASNRISLALPLASDRALANRLDFYLASPPDGDGPPTPRSPVWRAALELSPGPSGAWPVVSTTTFASPLESTPLLCLDGRVLVPHEQGLEVLDTRSSERVNVPLPGVHGVRRLIADWRCRYAYLATADRFVAVDLLNRRIAFESPVPQLLDITFDANPRYVLLIGRDGALRRYYMRDDEWSTTQGELPTAPLVASDGRALIDRDETRVVIATDGPALCVLLDDAKVRPHCAEVEVTPERVALLPFGFADEPYAPFSQERLAVRFEDDLGAETSPPGLGLALVVHGRSGTLFGLDRGLRVGELTWPEPPLDIVKADDGTVLFVHPATLGALDAFRLEEHIVAHFTSTPGDAILPLGSTLVRRHTTGIDVFARDEELGVALNPPTEPASDTRWAFLVGGYSGLLIRPELPLVVAFSERRVTVLYPSGLTVLGPGAPP